VLTPPTKLNDKDIPLSGRGRTLYEKYCNVLYNNPFQPVVKNTNFNESLPASKPSLISEKSDVADLEIAPSKTSSSQAGSVEVSKTITEKEIKLDLPGREELELLARKRDSFKLSETSSVEDQNLTSEHQGLDVTEINLPEIDPVAPSNEKVNSDSELESPSLQDVEPTSIKDLINSLFAAPVKVDSPDNSLAKDDLGELEEIKAHAVCDNDENDVSSPVAEVACETKSGIAVKSSEILSPQSSENDDIILPELPVYDSEEQVESELLNKENSDLKLAKDKQNELEELSEGETAELDTKTAKIMLPELMELHKAGSASSESRLKSSNDFQEIALPEINPLTSESTPPAPVPQAGFAGGGLLEKSGHKKGKMLLGHGSVAPAVNTKIRPASKVKLALITLLIIVILVGASFLDFEQLKSDFKSFFSQKENNEQTLNNVPPKSDVPEINTFDGEVIPATDTDSAIETTLLKDDAVIQTASEIEVEDSTEEVLPLLDSFSAKEEQIRQSDTDDNAVVHNEWLNSEIKESALRVLPPFSK